MKLPDLNTFFNAPSNSHAREAILMDRLCYDLKLAAARRGYYLNTYFDDVDKDGFDLILDDQDYIKKIQVKSLITSAATKTWGIHKRIVRPSIHLLDKLGIEPSPVGAGSEGGVVLIRFDPNKEDMGFEYFYTDAFVLLAFDVGILKRNHKSKQDAIDECLKLQFHGVGSERLSVPKAAFLRAKGPTELLALIGLHSEADTVWKWHSIQVANHTRQFADGSIKLPIPVERLAQSTFDEIGALVDDDDLERGGR